MNRPAPTRNGATKWLAWAVIPAMAAAALLALILWVVWPGAMAHAAPLACPAMFPDPFVQEHLYSVPGETRRSWSLVCMSAHGVLHRPGSAIPWALAMAILWLPCMAIALAAAPRIAREKGGKKGSENISV